MSSQAFEGKTALITGGSRGIGRATRWLRTAGSRRRRVQKTPERAALEVRHGRTIQRAERVRDAGRISVDKFDERGPPHVSRDARAAAGRER